MYTSILRSAEDRNLALQFVHYLRNLPRAVTLHTLGLQSRPVDSKVCRWPVGVPEPRVPLSAQAGPTRILRDQGIEHESGEGLPHLRSRDPLHRGGQVLFPIRGPPLLPPGHEPGPESGAIARQERGLAAVGHFGLRCRARERASERDASTRTTSRAAMADSDV